MIGEIQYLIAFIAGIAVMVRWGLFRRLLPPSRRLRIYDELRGRLKTSAPHLSPTLEGVDFDSGSSTSSAR
jgi:hypothetical protein